MTVNAARGRRGGTRRAARLVTVPSRPRRGASLSDRGLAGPAWPRSDPDQSHRLVTLLLTVSKSGALAR
eukprot:767132-Hanusia_phi.AAC.7